MIFKCSGILPIPSWIQWIMIVLIRPVSVYSWFLSNACCCCLLGVKIETTHSATMKRKYTVWGVSNLSAEKLQFEIEDEASKRRTKTTVAQYFLDTYRLALRYICFSMYTYAELTKKPWWLTKSISSFVWWSYHVLLKNNIEVINWGNDPQQAIANWT